MNRWNEGRCDDLCPTLCNSVECEENYEVSFDGLTCNCLSNTTMQCGIDAACVAEEVNPIVMNAANIFTTNRSNVDAPSVPWRSDLLVKA